MDFQIDSKHEDVENDDADATGDNDADVACTKTAMKLKGSTKTCRYLRVKFFKDFVIRLKGCIFVDLREVYILV